MAPSHLQGLNIVHPVPPSNAYVSDADLLSIPSSFSDLNAQLDLWTNLNFQSDEPLVSSRPGEGKSKDIDGKHSDTSEDDVVVVGKPGAGGKKSKTKRKGRQSLSAGKHLGKDELVRQTQEIQRDKENIHVRRVRSLPAVICFQNS